MLDVMLFNLVTLLPVGLHILSHDRKELRRLLPLLIIICMSAIYVVIGHLISEYSKSLTDTLDFLYPFHDLTSECIRVFVTSYGIQVAMKHTNGCYNNHVHICMKGFLVMWGFCVMAISAFVWFLILSETAVFRRKYPGNVTTNSVILVMLYSGMYFPPFIGGLLFSCGKSTCRDIPHTFDMPNMGEEEVDLITCRRCSSSINSLSWLLFPFCVSLNFIRQGGLLYTWWTDGILELYGMEYCTMPIVYCMCLIHLGVGVLDHLEYKWHMRYMNIAIV